MAQTNIKPAQAETIESEPYESFGRVQMGIRKIFRVESCRTGILPGVGTGSNTSFHTKHYPDVAVWFVEGIGLYFINKVSREYNLIPMAQVHFCKPVDPADVDERFALPALPAAKA